MHISHLDLIYELADLDLIYELAVFHIFLIGFLVLGPSWGFLFCSYTQVDPPNPR